jgi:hypothetical protein
MEPHRHAVASADVTDPVCDMSIDPTDAVAHVDPRLGFQVRIGVMGSAVDGLESVVITVGGGQRPR